MLRDSDGSRYRVDRPTQTDHDVQQRRIEGNNIEELITSNTAIKRKSKKCGECSKKCFVSSIVGLLPIFSWLRHYEKKWLPGDIVSGLTVGVVHIPQSLAFAILAGLAPVFGLYTSFYPVLIYALMGTSRHISVGTFAVTSLLTRSVVLRYYPPVEVNATMTMNTTIMQQMNDTVEMNFTDLDLKRAGVASAVMLLMGIFQVIFGIFRLGFITSYLSEPLIQGFTTGAACHVVTSQIPTILGIQVQSFNGPFAFIKVWVEIFKNISQIHFATLLITVFCLVVLVVGREINVRYRQKLKVPLPTEVILVIIVILASYFGHFEEKFGVVVVDNVPTGIPPPALPTMSIVGEIIPDAFALAIVGFAISVSLSKMYGMKYGYSIDANQEWIAYGTSNIIPSFFLCFPNAAALARCEIQDNTGGNTQVVGIISVVIVLIIILVMGPLFEPLPRAVLGCIIIVGLLGIILQFRHLKTFFKTSKIDFVVWIVTWLAVVLLGVDIGLFVGVLFSIITTIVRTQNPRFEVLTNISGTDIYRANGKYQNQTETIGVLIVKLYSSLYYVNGDYFKSKLVEVVGFDPAEKTKKQQARQLDLGKEEKMSDIKMSTLSDSDQEDNITTEDNEKYISASTEVMKLVNKVDRKNNIHTIIVDCSSFGFIDFSGGKILKQFYQDFNDIGISFYLSSCSDDVWEQLERSGYFIIAGENSTFITIHDAVIFATHNQS